MGVSGGVEGPHSYQRKAFLKRFGKHAMDTSPSEKVYPVLKIALVFDALAAEGMSIDGALKQMRLSKDAIT